MIVKVKKLHPDVLMPQYSHPGDAGMDIYNMGEEVTLKPLSRALIPTGLKVAVPQGYELQVRPRSGLALKHGITLLNTPGTIDADYRGPLNLIVCNFGREAFHLRRGDRIAQMVIAKVERARLEVVEELEPTPRGEGGFGHTGL